jgi:regulator of protease activity HflC (stomatin/prohibitin superfamily)
MYMHCWNSFELVGRSICFLNWWLVLKIIIFRIVLLAVVAEFLFEQWFTSIQYAVTYVMTSATFTATLPLLSFFFKIPFYLQSVPVHSANCV